MDIKELIEGYLKDEEYLKEVEKKENKRTEIKKDVLEFLEVFLSARSALEGWKDQLKKLNSGWGIGNSIPMMSSVLKTSQESGRIGLLEAFVRRHLSVPKLLELRRVSELIDFVEDNYDSRRSQSSRVLFLLSIFWNIQEPENYPVFFPKIKKAVKLLREKGLFFPSGEIETIYDEYYDLVLVYHEAVGMVKAHNLPFYHAEHFIIWAMEKSSLK